VLVAAETSPMVGLFLVVWIGFAIYCAVQCARNGRWLLFALGFLCGGIFWVIGAFGSEQAGSAAMKRREKAYASAGAKRVVMKQRPQDGRCPACGKRDQWGNRCTICKTFLGAPMRPPDQI
jgi:hypothetical protein